MNVKTDDGEILFNETLVLPSKGYREKSGELHIINILKGQLSMIGPRPVIDEELEKYRNNKENFLSVTLGVTGHWAVSLFANKKLVNTAKGVA